MYIFDEIEIDCFSCDQKDNKLTDIKYWLIHLVDQLYSEKPIDAQELERSLEEVCHIVDVSIPDRPINISQHKDFSENIKEYKPLNSVEEWVRFNNEYLKQLAI